VKTVGNILWLVIVGWATALTWLLAALILAITIVGIPFARQCLKFARFSLWPFGRTAIDDPTATPLGCVGNVLWFIPGLFLAIEYALLGALLAITIIGIPFAVQAFKFIPLAVFPFGKRIVRIDELGAPHTP
jgi:uncharacterized membrane protein YccF (DUF307 family)